MTDAELNGHTDIVEQCRDHLASKADLHGDPTGRLTDFVESIGKVLEGVAELRQSLDDATGPHCSSCGNAIDPDVCHCGDYVKDHNQGHGHSPVPMGCVCGYAEPDWQRLAISRGEMLWKTRKHLAEVKAELAHERELTEARRIVARAARKIVRDEHLAELQRESARVNEMGGVIAHLVGVLAEVHRATTIENAKTFAEIALADHEAWHAGTWAPGPGSDPADWKPGHHREQS